MVKTFKKLFFFFFKNRKAKEHLIAYTVEGWPNCKLTGDILIVSFCNIMHESVHPFTLLQNFLTAVQNSFKLGDRVSSGFQKVGANKLANFKIFEPIFIFRSQAWTKLDSSNLNCSIDSSETVLIQVK